MLTTPEQFKATSLFKNVYAYFTEETKKVNLARQVFSTAECLQSGLAILHQKFPSLLQFDKEHKIDKNIENNMKNLYGVDHVPCDTQLRKRLDDVPVEVLQKSMKPLINQLQRSKKLHEWSFFSDGSYIVAVDGVHYYSSENVKCDHCLVKVHNKGKTDKKTGESIEYEEYTHSALAAVICHPTIRQVLPLTYEPICNADGNTKNDCELNAGKRFVGLFRKLYPKMNVTFTLDCLYTNGVFLSEILEKGCSFIGVVSEDKHKFLYDHIARFKKEEMQTFEVTDDKKHRHVYECMSNVPLNGTHMELLVSFVSYKEYDETGKQVYRGAWVTDKKIMDMNFKGQQKTRKGDVVKIVQAGRVRWKIENETFNTLKNQGYNFEHNFGHGCRNLCNIFVGLMFLAFMIDQVLEATNKEFLACKMKLGSFKKLWWRIRSYFELFIISSWEDLYEVILRPPRRSAI